MTQIVILLSVTQYSISDDNGKVENEGCTARYLIAEDLTPYEETGRKTKGRVPAKANLPFSDYDKFQKVPGLYQAELDYTVDSRGRAAITATGFKFLSEISINKDNAVKGFQSK